MYGVTGKHWPPEGMVRTHSEESKECTHGAHLGGPDGGLEMGRDRNESEHVEQEVEDAEMEEYGGEHSATEEFLVSSEL